MYESRELLSLNNMIQLRTATTIIWFTISTWHIATCNLKRNQRCSMQWLRSCAKNSIYLNTMLSRSFRQWRELSYMIQYQNISPSSSDQFYDEDRLKYISNRTIYLYLLNFRPVAPVVESVEIDSCTPDRSVVWKASKVMFRRMYLNTPSQENAPVTMWTTPWKAWSNNTRWNHTNMRWT